jgi:hypothetical protein
VGRHVGDPWMVHRRSWSLEDATWESDFQFRMDSVEGISHRYRKFEHIKGLEIMYDLVQIYELVSTETNLKRTLDLSPFLISDDRIQHMCWKHRIRAYLSLNLHLRTGMPGLARGVDYFVIRLQIGVL